MHCLNTTPVRAVVVVVGVALTVVQRSLLVVVVLLLLVILWLGNGDPCISTAAVFGQIRWLVARLSAPFAVATVGVWGTVPATVTSTLIRTALVVFGVRFDGQAAEGGRKGATA